VWPGLIERTNVPVGFDAHLQQDPYLPTDSTMLYQAEVPTLNLFTGSHEDYHRPSDVPSKIRWDDLERVATFTARMVANLDALDERPEWVEVERTPARGGDRDSVRAYTGTIPDYATEVAGLRLSGVIPGGPAAKAGLREGDVIVELGGRTIANIYDYTFALDAVKIDQPTKVVFVRDGERQEVEIIPTSRP
jgi:C-terminal processing protease CtpA/Prc